MTYRELFYKATRLINKGEITLGEYDEMTKPLEREIEQQPCEMTTEEYRQRMIQAFHNADTDELIAVCVLPTEKEFEHLEWLLKNHYKKAPCDDAISRDAACKMICAEFVNPQDGMQEWRNAVNDVVENILHKVEQLPSVTPTCEEREKGECPYYAG